MTGGKYISRQQNKNNTGTAIKVQMSRRNKSAKLREEYKQKRAVEEEQRNPNNTKSKE